MLAEAQRQQKELNDKYAAKQRAEKAEAAVRGRGGRKGKGRETQGGRKAGGEVATTKSTLTRARAGSITQLVISPKKKKART